MKVKHAERKEVGRSSIAMCYWVQITSWVLLRSRSRCQTPDRRLSQSKAVTLTAEDDGPCRLLPTQCTILYRYKVKVGLGNAMKAQRRRDRGIASLFL